MTLKQWIGSRGVLPEQLHPLTEAQRVRWELAKNGRSGKSLKKKIALKNPPPKAVPTLINVEPRLLRRADAYAKKAGVSRSQLFSDALRQRIKSAE